MAIVTAHGVAAHSQYGGDAAARLQRAMETAILACNAEGITNDEVNSPIIAKRMRLAHQTELLAIMREEHAQALHAFQVEFRQKIVDLQREGTARLEEMAAGHHKSEADVEATIAELTQS